MGTMMAPAAAAAAPSVPKNIAEIRIEGAGNHLLENPARDYDLVDDFVKSLRDSPFYEKGQGGVVIEVAPSPTMQGQTFTFTILARLLKPLSL
jgi:hypothetical protein